MTSQTLSYQSPAFTAEYFFEELPLRKSHSFKTITLSSLLMHIAVVALLIVHVPKLQLDFAISNLAPTPETLELILNAPAKMKTPEPVVEPQPTNMPKPEFHAEDILTTKNPNAAASAPIKPKPVPEAMPQEAPKPAPKLAAPAAQPNIETKPETPKPVVEPVTAAPPPIPKELTNLLDNPAPTAQPPIAEAVSEPLAKTEGESGQTAEDEAAATQEAYLKERRTDIMGQMNKIKRYPPLALKRNIFGTVKLGLVFNSAGVLDDVVIKQSSGSKILDKAAIKDAKRVLKKAVDVRLARNTLLINVQYQLN